MYIYIYICMNTYRHMYRNYKYIYTYICMHTYKQMYTDYTYIHIYYTYIHICVGAETEHIYIYTTRDYTYIHIYYTRAYKYIHIYYTFIPICTTHIAALMQTHIYMYTKSMENVGSIRI